MCVYERIARTYNRVVNIIELLFEKRCGDKKRRTFKVLNFMNEIGNGDDRRKDSCRLVAFFGYVKHQLFLVEGWTNQGLYRRISNCCDFAAVAGSEDG